MRFTTSENPLRVSYLVLGCALVLVIAVLIVAAVALRKQGRQGAEFAQGLSGQISLTLTTASSTDVYRLAADSGKLKPAAIVGGDEPRRATISATGRLAYVCMSGGKEAVCVFDPETGKRTAISRNDSLIKHDLRWSPDGESVMYTAWDESATSSADSPIAQSMDPDLWGVFLAKADGSEETRVATGSTAFFSPDGATVFHLKRGGLYAVDLASGSVTSAWHMTEGFAHRFMQIAVSPANTRLAWADQAANDNAGKIAIYDITSWSPFTLALKEEIPARAWSLGFSPDGSSLAFISYENSRPKLYIRRGDAAPEEIADLGDYGRNAFISEWR